jgi:ABC-2 type transport system ATP-binding protein
VAAGTPSELKRRIGGGVVEVHVRDRADLPVVAAALRRVDHGDVRIDEVTRRVSVRVEPGGGRLIGALRSVEGAGIEVDDIALRQPNLDEVFLALTGRSRDGQTDAADDAA